MNAKHFNFNRSLSRQEEGAALLERFFSRHQEKLDVDENMFFLLKKVKTCNAFSRLLGVYEYLYENIDAIADSFDREDRGDLDSLNDDKKNLLFLTVMIEGFRSTDPIGRAFSVARCNFCSELSRLVFVFMRKPPENAFAKFGIEDSYLDSLMLSKHVRSEYFMNWFASAELPSPSLFKYCPESGGVCSYMSHEGEVRLWRAHAEQMQKAYKEVTPVY